MAYVRQTWKNLPNETTPITAARLSHMETQYDKALIEVEATSDVTTGANIDRPSSQSQQAVDRRISGVAADIIASDGTVIAAAALAVGDELADAAVLLKTELGAPISLNVDDPLFAEVRVTFDYRRVGGRLKAGGEVGLELGYTDSVVTPGTGTVIVTKDFRRADPAGGLDGSLPPAFFSRVGAESERMTALTNWSDSMGRDHASIGVSVIAECAQILGVEAHDRGFSGDTPTQVAARAGTQPIRVTVADGTIPATGTATVTVDNALGWRGPRTWHGTLRALDGASVRVSLVQDDTAPDVVAGWTVQQTGGVAPAGIAPGARFMHVDADPVAVSSPAMIWVGRNDLDVERGRAAVSSLVSELRDRAQRFIVVSVFNLSWEPSGHAGYASVMAFNAMLAEVAGEKYWDGRAQLIACGLEAAGITATPDDLAAIAEDRIPPSLMADTTHLNAAGRIAFARLLANEILGRNW